MNAKAELRQKIRKELRELTPEFKKEASHKICLLLWATHSNFPERKVAIFAATPSEPDLSSLHELLPEHQFYYPLCHAEGKMTFHHVQNPNELIAGRHGIRAPNPEIHPTINPQDLELILCPGLAFTEKGHRLGQGGGYYDRYLPLTKNSAVIGVAFSNQIILKIPVTKNDQKVDIFVTENAWQRVKESKKGFFANVLRKFIPN